MTDQLDFEVGKATVTIKADYDSDNGSFSHYTTWDAYLDNKPISFSNHYQELVDSFLSKCSENMRADLCA